MVHCRNRVLTMYTLGILCGGKGSRMGGVDKGWLSYGSRSFVETAIHRFQSDSLVSHTVIISANRNRQRYQQLGVRVVPDQRPGFIGPLAGLEALVDAASADQPLIVLACDMPDLPDDLAQRLLNALLQEPEETVVIAHDGVRPQPLCMALYPSRAQHNLKVFLDNGGRGVFQWLKQRRVREVRYIGQQACFGNINDQLSYQDLVSQQQNARIRSENNAQSLHFGYDPRHESYRSRQLAPTS